jgi:hypothetical protein
MAQTFQDIEKAAEYTPSVGANILNLLTGGIYGGVTGKTRQAQEAERLRQMLRQETFSERGEERALDRQMRRALIGQMLTEGVQLEPGQQPEKMNVFDMAQMLRSQQAKNAVLAEAGTRTGFGYSDIPTQEQAASPAFQTAASKAASEMYGMRARTLAEEEISRPRIIAQLNALDVKFDPATPTAGLDALLSRKKAVLSQEQSSQFAREFTAETAKEWLNMYNDSVAEDEKIKTEGMTPAQLIAAKDTVQRKIEQAKLTAGQRREEGVRSYQNSIRSAITSGDINGAKRLVYESPYKEIRDSDYWQSEAGTQVSIPKKKEEELAELPTQMNDAVSFVRNVGKLAKGRNINEVSKMSFNTLTSTLDQFGAAYFGNDEARNALQSIKQEFEGIVSKGRKTLFGASLTDRELASAKTLFGDYSNADFLPRAIQFIDKVFAMKPSERYPGYLGMGRHDRAVEPLMNEYSTIRSTLNWVPFESMVSRNQPVTVTGPSAQTPAAGVTNRVRINSAGTAY